MRKVVLGATVSLDGYIAGPNESGFEHLFAWFDGGDRELPSVDPNFHARLSEPDYRYMRDFVHGIGVFVAGRRMFDLTGGWGGRHPFDKSIVVVTHSVPQDWVAAHPVAPFTFVTNGLLGSGVRFLDELKAAPLLLDGPDLLVEGSRVTHLRYHVRRS
jgi:dihydrofolate reductase